MSHVKQSDTNHTSCLTVSDTGPLPAWAEMLLRLHCHIPLDTPALSRIALRAVLNHLVDDIDRYAFCLGVVGADPLDSALVSSAQLRETLYVMQEGEEFQERNVYPTLGEFEALGMQVPESRKRFYKSLEQLNDDPLSCFKEPGRSAFVISLGGMTLGVICPGDGFGAKRIVVHRNYCEPFLSICRDLGCLEVLFAQSDDLADHGCCITEQSDQDAYSGLLAEIDKRFSPELIDHDVPAHVMGGFKNLARRFDANPSTWQAMSHGERLQINRDRFRYLVLPQMYSRYGFEEGAEADLMRVIGLADRVLGDDMADLGGVSSVLDQIETFLSDHRNYDPELIEACRARLDIVKTFRQAICTPPRQLACEKRERTRLHHFLFRLARRACQAPGSGVRVRSCNANNGTV